MKTLISKNGTMEIPKVFQKKLGIKEGAMVDIQVKGNTLVVVKIVKKDAVDKVYGCIGRSLNTDEIIDELRGKS